MVFPETPAQRVFWRITAWRWPIVILCLVLIAGTGAFIPTLVNDTSADGFIDADDPALVYRERVEEIFGLKDPIVTAVIASHEDGVFDPETLELVSWLTDRIERLSNVDPARVTSLATENHVVGTFDGMIVEEFFERDGDHFRAPLDSTERGVEIRAAIEDFPLYQGSLVARDGSATIIISELIDEEASEATYDEIMAIVAEAPIPGGVEVHVAGEGAVAGYLATYIARDAQRLNPIAGLVITTVLALAFFSLRGAVLPNILVLGTVAASLGLMAASEVSFYVITNGLIVNLIGIAVAGSIHIFSQYYEELRQRPDAEKREIVVRAMAGMWRPVTLTTVTTAAGFLALAASAEMPPIRYFGLFGALGIGAAWVYSMTLLPAAMTLWPRKRLPRPFRDTRKETATDLSSRFMIGFGRVVLARPRVILGIAAVITVAGVAGATQIVANDARIDNFQSSEPLYQADQAINRAMDGTYYLDVMVETADREDLHRPENLRRIEALQDFLVTLPHVNGATSVVDYIKQMHRAVNENRIEDYRLPDDPLLIAQLFFLYNASGDPTDFQEEVDYNYQRALVRANVDNGEYLTNRVLVPAVERYLVEEFDEEGITGTVTGRVNVDYHWINGIAGNHAWSVALSFGAVLLMVVAVFRSALGGVIAVIPVAMSVLLVYAVMGYGGVWLGVGTSMFAAIAIGLGVDFAIHTVERIRVLARQQGLTDDVLLKLFPSTGRALLFNFLAVALGFGVLVTSDVPPLIEFGALVAVAVSTAFLAAMTVVPALIKLVRPGFLTQHPQEIDMPETKRAPIAGLGLAMLIGTGLALSAADAPAQTLSGLEVMQRVEARDDGEHVTRAFTLELTDRNGSTRVEETVGFRRDFGDERRSIIFYTEPTNVRGTGFLTFDYPNPGVDDDQWLYLPALRRVRRISASDRGDYFLGTDFTYEEIKQEQKVELSDYTFEAIGTEMVDGVETVVVEGIPVNEDIADELRQSRAVWRIDPDIWMSRLTDYYDINGNHVRTVRLERVERIDGIDTAMQVFVQNHLTGHSTRLTFADVDYEAAVDAQLFSQARLRRGL